MIETISLTNFLSYRDKTVFNFTATSERPAKGYEYLNWYQESAHKKILKALFLFGNNGTGKSNFLNVFTVLKEIVTGRKREKGTKGTKLPSMAFRFSKDTLPKPSTIEIVFHTKGKRYYYKIEWTEEFIQSESLSLYKSPKNEIKIFYRHYDNAKDISIVDFYDNKRISEESQQLIRENVIKNTSVISIYDSKNFESEDIRNVFYYFNGIRYCESYDNAILPILISRRKNEDKLKEILLELLPTLGTNIADYQLEEHKTKISEMEAQIFKIVMGEEVFLKEFPNGERTEAILRFGHKIKNSDELFWLPYHMESSGTINMIELIIHLFDAMSSRSPFCIDECSMGIHQKVFNRIIQFFIKSSEMSQVFFASQSTYILSMEGYRRDSSRFFDKHPEDGTTFFKTVDLKKFHKTLNLENQYINNSFGGIPSLLKEDEWKNQLDILKYKILNDKDSGSSEIQPKI